MSITLLSSFMSILRYRHGLISLLLRVTLFNLMPRSAPKGGNLSSRRLTRAVRDQGVAVRMTNGRVTIRPVQLGQQRLAFGGDAARQKTAGALAALAMQKHEFL